MSMYGGMSSPKKYSIFDDNSAPELSARHSSIEKGGGRESTGNKYSNAAIPLKSLTIGSYGVGRSL